MTSERWESTIASNLSVTFHTVAAFLRHVRSTGRGNVVLIGSTAGLLGEAGHSDYAAAKERSSPGSSRSRTRLLSSVRASGSMRSLRVDGDPDDRRRQVGPELDGAGDRDHAVEETRRPEDVPPPLSGWPATCWRGTSPVT